MPRDDANSLKGDDLVNPARDKLHLIAQPISQILVETDATGQLLGDLALYQAFLGEKTGGGWAESVHPEDRAEAIAAWQAAAAGRLPFKGLCRLRRADGAWRRVQIDLTPVRDEGVEGAMANWVGLITDITERRLLEEELRDTRRRFEMALSHLPITLFEQDLDLRYRWIHNPALGYGTSEVIGKSEADLMDPSAAEQLSSLKRRAIETGSAVHEEVVAHAYGSPMEQFDLYVEPYRDEAGAIVGVVCAGVDITARKGQETALRDSQQRTRLATEVTGVGLWEWNMLTDRLRWDDQMFRLYGIEPTPDGEMGYEVWSNAVAPEELAEQQRQMARIAAEGGTGTREFTIRRASDGQLRRLRAVEASRKNAQGHVEWLVGTNLDITENELAKTALQQSEERFRDLFEQSPDGIFVADASGHYVDVNPAGCALLGYTHAEVVGLTLADVLAAKEHRRLAEQMSSLAVGAATTTEWTFRHKDGSEFIGELTGRRLPDGRLQGILRDISERKAAEGLIRQRNRQLDLLARTSQRLLYAEEPSAVLASIFQDIADLLDVEMFYHFCPGDEEATLRLATFAGITGQEQRFFATARHGEWLCGRVAETGQRLIIEDLQNSDQPGSEVLAAAGATSYAGFPLTANGALMGTIAFVSRQRRYFHPGDIQTIQAICDQIATKMERVRLADELAAREAQLRQAIGVAAAGVWQLTPETGAFWASEQAMILLGLPPGAAMDHEGALAAVHPDDRPFVDAAVHHAVATGEPLKMELRTLWPDGTVHWLSSVAERQGEGSQTRLLGLVTDITERKQREEQVQLLMREVNHRSKNMLTVVMAIAQQTAATGAVDFIGSFSDRVRALAANQDVLIRHEWKAISLESLIRTQLAHLGNMLDRRITLAGPAVDFLASASQPIGLALHELATNALKYGALSVPAGRVEIRWHCHVDAEGNGRFAMSWEEKDGPPVTRPKKTGFGTMVIGRMVDMSLRCDPTIDFAPNGLVWKFDGPASRVLDSASLKRSIGVSKPQPTATPGRRVLVVEDEPLIAIEICDNLSEAGLAVIGPATTVAEALQLIEGTGCDAAILDINLGTETAEPIALMLRGRHIPFVAVSGYTRDQSPQTLQDVAHLSKPLEKRLLLAEVRRCLSISAAGRATAS